MHAYAAVLRITPASSGSWSAMERVIGVTDKMGLLGS